MKCLVTDQAGRLEDTPFVVHGEGRVVRKPCDSSGQWVQKHAGFAPARQSLLGFRLRSPLPIGGIASSLGSSQCPLSLQTVFSPTDLRLIIGWLG